jgi:hypothetical protein
MTFTVLRESCPKNKSKEWTLLPFYAKMPSLITFPHPWCVRVGAAQRDPVRSQSGSCAVWIVSEGFVSEAPLTLKSG